jgi:hypothetical protein
MATIIEFRARTPLQERVTPSGTRDTSADVVLFPGVRYERAEADEAEDVKPRSRRSRQRDRLDLDE